MSGYKARKNTYTCQKCRTMFVTVDRDDGTTPALASCRSFGGKCRDGMARSSWYHLPPECPEATHEWYAPTPKEARAAGPAMEDHAKKGGLFLRRIGAPGEGEGSP